MSVTTLLPEVHFRPKGQLLKWIGNKYRYAEGIVSYFPNDYNKYIEPFVGTGAVLATLCPENAIASDTLKPLVEIWQILQNNPEKLVNHYHDNIIKFYKDRVIVYNNIKDRFNANPNGLDLVLLSRTCYGGVVRFTQEGKMSTPIGPHNPITPESFEQRVYEWTERVKDVKFYNQSFETIMQQAKYNDVIYCDPPYIDSQAILYGAQKFKFDELVRCISECKDRGAKVVLSIDGKKKSGEKKILINVPKDLFEREVYLDCGSSMLRRLQNGGRTMIGEDVHDRLLLTW